MKKSGVIAVICISIIILSLSLVSANIFTDFFSKWFNSENTEQTGELYSVSGFNCGEEITISNINLKKHKNIPKIPENAEFRREAVTSKKLCELMGFTMHVSSVQGKFSNPEDYSVYYWEGNNFIGQPATEHNGWIKSLTCIEDCCTPKTCSDIDKECGKWDNNCGGEVDCGSCNDNENCESGICKEMPKAECTDSDNGLKPYIYGWTNFKLGSFELKHEDACAIISNYDLNGNPSGWQGVDSCSEKDCYVEEAFCRTDNAGNFIDADADKLIKCSNGCKDGTCINKTQPTCTDSDNGKNYETKGTTTSGNIKSTDSCVDNKNLKEYYCFDGVESETHECSNKCENGVCINKPFEILDNFTYVYHEDYSYSLVEEGQNITFYHRIKINKDNIDFAPESYLIKIKKEEEIKSIEVFKKDSKCFSRGYCYVEYSNVINDLPAGDYEIVGMGNYGKFKILEEGWHNKNLVLDNKYGEYTYFGFYDPFSDSTRIVAVYYLNEDMESPGNKIAGLMILNNSETTDREFNNLFNEFFEELIDNSGALIQPVNFNGDNIYLFKLVEERSNFGIILALWKGKNYIVYIAEIIENKDKREIDITEEEFMRGLMGRGHSYKKGDVNIDDFSKLGGELVEDYLEKWESTLTHEPITCFSLWECSLTPLICPEYGRQTETCEDVNECSESYERAITCQPGLCSGCIHNEKCIPYGSRFQSEEEIISLLTTNPKDVSLITVEDNEDIEKPTPAKSGGGGGGAKAVKEKPTKPQKINYYCDIDGRIKKQKTIDYQGNWANCQNNYECESNFCTSGECIEITQTISKYKGFKGLIFTVLCKIAHPLSNEKYNQCIINTIGEEYLEEPEEPEETPPTI